MRTVITFFIVVLFSNFLLSQPTYFGQNYLHANTAANCYDDYTLLNSAEIGNSPTDRLIFNHVWGLPDGSHAAYMPHSNGLWFTGAEWSIYDETTAAMDTNLAYNVLNAKQNGTSFLHTVTSLNLVLNRSLIDHPLLNGHPEAIFFISKTWENGVYDTAHVGIWYDISSTKWTIYNEDNTQTLELNSTYNIFIPNSGPSCFKHEAISTSYITSLDNPFLNGNPDARIFVVHDFTTNALTEGYIKDEIGVWYDGAYWTIFSETLPNLFLGATFNVLIVANYPTGVQSNPGDHPQLILSPNPAGEKLNISMNPGSSLSMKEITIIGMDGLTVLEKTLEGNNLITCQLDVSAIQPGLYILTVQNNAGSLTKKLNIVR